MFRSPQTLKNAFVPISATDCRLLENLVFACTFKKSLFPFPVAYVHVEMPFLKKEN
jgi:hypothetical protein